MREQRAERLLYLMTQLPDEMLDEAIVYQKPAPRIVFWNKGALVAACLCICLIGGLAWGNTLRNPIGETGSTGAGVAAGGASGAQGVKPTLAPSTDQTGARPADSTDESLTDTTQTVAGTSDGEIGMMVSEFWYKGQLYVDTGIVLEKLPDSCQAFGALLGENWLTQDKALIGAKVYRMEGDDVGLYVETVGGYRYYGKGQ